MQRKRIVLIGGAGLLIILGAIAYYFLRPINPEYQIAVVTERDLSEVVRANGIISSAQNVDLSFDRSGRIARNYVNIGDKVKVGDKLVELENSFESAQLAQAEAALNQRAAGATAEQIAAYQASADAAKAALQETSDGGSLITTQAKENEVTTLSQTLPVLDASLSQADNIVAVDNTFANENFKDVLSVQDKLKLGIAVGQYRVAKNSLVSFRTLLTGITNTSSNADVTVVANSALSALSDMNLLLSNVFDVLNASLSQGALAQPVLDTKKAAILTARASVTGQSASLQSKMQAVDIAATTLVQKKAAYDQAVATLKSATDPIRSVDLDPLRAAVATASAGYNKTVLRSPVDGAVSRNDAKVGGVVTANSPLVSVINPNNFQIETYIPENSIGNIKNGDSADVTTDAFGGSIIFSARVKSVDQSAVINNGSQSYKVVLVFEQPDSRLKAGMNANVNIKIGETRKVLAISERSVIEKDNKYYVFIKNGKTEEEREITVGQKGGGYFEILSGLKSGDQVINFGQ